MPRASAMQKSVIRVYWAGIDGPRPVLSYCASRTLSWSWLALSWSSWQQAPPMALDGISRPSAGTVYRSRPTEDGAPQVSPPAPPLPVLGLPPPLGCPRSRRAAPRRRLRRPSRSARGSAVGRSFNRVAFQPPPRPPSWSWPGCRPGADSPRKSMRDCGCARRHPPPSSDVDPATLERGRDRNQIDNRQVVLRHRPPATTSA